MTEENAHPPKSLRFGSAVVHAGQVPDPTTGSRAPPIYLTASYVFKNTAHAAALFGLEEPGNIYTRLMNPTTDMLEKRVAAVEGGTAAVAVASGMAAISTALLTITEPGDEIVSADNLYGGTYELFHYTFPKLSRSVVFVDSQDAEAFEKAITPKTRAVYLESLGNPKLDIPDFEAISKIARKAGVPLIVDNTAAVGLIRPIAHGADVVVHSATKFMCGHGTALGGTIVDAGTFDWNNGKFPGFSEPDPGYHGLVYGKAFENTPDGNVAFASKVRLQYLRDLGCAISPFNAFEILQGLETLALRMKKHSENALEVARFLEGHKNVAWVNYPGLDGRPGKERADKYMSGGYGGLIGFGVAGGLEAGKKVIDSLKLFSHLANIGDSKSLVIHPASTTHQQLTEEEQKATGVTPDFIRLSIGIEDAQDLIDDLKQALDKI